MRPRDRGVGPPERERPQRFRNRQGPNHESATTTDEPTPTTQPRRCALDTVPVAWRRRRQAGYRLVPMDCGCRTADPWPCRCTQPPLTDRALDGWRDAANHVLDCGQIALVPLEVRRALWRRQGSDRLLAERLHQACGEVAS